MPGTDKKRSINMKTDIDWLRFTNEVEDPVESSDWWYVEINGSAQGKEGLFDELSKKLNFPSYFGCNWDALNDLLRDFHWVKSRGIYLSHKVVPELSTEELRKYLKILANAVRDWNIDEKHSSHELIVKFPEGSKGQVEKILNSDISE